MKYVTKDGKEFDNYEEAKAYESAFDSPARTIVFYGHSDDVVVVSNYSKIGSVEEFEGNDTFGLISEHGRMKIHPVYDGCWSFAVGLWDEGRILPDWDIKFNYEGYSVHLEISVPAGTAFMVNPQ